METKDSKERRGGVQRVVLHWVVASSSYAMEFSLYPTMLTLFLHRVWPSRLTQVRGCFVWCRKGNLTPQGAQRIGHLALCREELDLDLVVHEVYHAVSRVRGLGRHTEEQCATMAGALAAAVCSQLLLDGESLIPSRDTAPAVQAVKVSSFENETRR